MEKTDQVWVHEAGPSLKTPHERADAQALHTPPVLHRPLPQRDKLTDRGQALFLNPPPHYCEFAH